MSKALSLLPLAAVATLTSTTAAVADQANIDLVNTAFEAQSNARDVVNKVLNDPIFQEAYPHSLQPSLTENQSLCRNATSIGSALFRLPFPNEAGLSSGASASYFLMQDLEKAQDCLNETIEAYKTLGPYNYIRLENDRLVERIEEVCAEDQLASYGFQNVQQCQDEFANAVAELPTDFNEKLSKWNELKTLMENHQATLEAAGLTQTP